jgi:Tfp pilus assembly protein PilF
LSQFDDGMRAFERGDFRKAAALFNAAIDQGERVAAALSKRGVCRLKWGDAAQAEHDFRAALAVDAGCASAMVNLGNLMLERGELDEAQVCYERALRVDETYALAHHNLGVLLRKRGDINGSIHELRLAGKLETKPPRSSGRWGSRKKRSR